MTMVPYRSPVFVASSVNIETGLRYMILGNAFDMTEGGNDRGREMVLYMNVNGNYFVRDIKEFNVKFRAIGE